MASSSGILSSISSSLSSSRIVFGNGSSLPVTHTGHTSLATNSNPLHLQNVLVTPNLLSVRALTRDNPVSVEFDYLVFH